MWLCDAEPGPKELLPDFQAQALLHLFNVLNAWELFSLDIAVQIEIDSFSGNLDSVTPHAPMINLNSDFIKENEEI